MHFYFCTSLPEQEFSHDNDQKRNKSPYLKISHGFDQIRKNQVAMIKKEACMSKNLQHQSHSSSLLSKTNHFFQLPALHVNMQTSCLTAPLLPWTNSLVPTMWFLKRARTDLVDFLCSRVISITWMEKLKCSRKMTTKTFAWSKISQWER